MRDAKKNKDKKGVNKKKQKIKDKNRERKSEKIYLILTWCNIKIENIIMMCCLSCRSQG